MNHLEVAKRLAVEAGRKILEVYATDFSVDYKDDSSPLTRADRMSHEVIVDGLSSAFPDIPVVSEESLALADYETRKGWSRFWLVDPLDGTKEFVKRNGEFTVNIALVEGIHPILGVLHVPVSGKLYYGSVEGGAWRGSVDNLTGERIGVSGVSCGEPLVVVKSRSHPSPELEEFLSGISVKDDVSAGSALKFCLVADGTADLYPRFGPTWEWDTAAGQAIVEAAGGEVVDPDGKRLEYNKPVIKNGKFIVRGCR